MAKQVREVLRTAVWSDSPGALVLGDSVYITAGVREDDDLPVRMPFALVNLGPTTADPDDPNLLSQEIVVVLAVQVLGDPLGECSLVGGPGADSNRFGYSDGRGLLEMEAVLLASVGRLTGADGATIEVSLGSAPAPERLGDDTHLVHRQYVLRATCTRAEEWPAPSELVVGVGTAGQMDITWALAPDRYGRRKTVVRYAASSTPPASASAGTPVTVATETTTSATVSGLAPGTYSVAIFTPYTETGSDSDERYSSQVTGTTRTVVVT
jgi:hypothetical protein